MTKDSPEYLKIKAEYEAKEQYKKDHPEEYPWFVYFQFGWHHMTYMTDAEKDETVSFYHLYGNSKGGYERHGRQPILITKRKEVRDADS